MIETILNENILEIVIDSGKGNLLSLQDLITVNDLVVDAEHNVEIHGVLMTGKGRSFSAGLDLPSQSGALDVDACMDCFCALDKLLVNLFSFSKPLIAAVNGHSVGAGLLLHLCADHAIAADDKRIKIGLPELSLGLTIDAVMVNLIRYSISSDKELQKILFSGDLFDPLRALQLTMIDEIITDERLHDAALNHCKQLIKKGLPAFRATKKTLRHVTMQQMKSALDSKEFQVFEELLRLKHS